MPWSPTNAAAFAGLHNQSRRTIIVFDEASAIPDVIWDTTEGAQADFYAASVPPWTSSPNPGLGLAARFWAAPAARPGLPDGGIAR